MFRIPVLLKAMKSLFAARCMGWGETWHKLAKSHFWPTHKQTVPLQLQPALDYTKISGVSWRQLHKWSVSQLGKHFPAWPTSWQSQLIDKEEPFGEEEVNGSGDDAEMTVMSKQREQDYQQNHSLGLWENRLFGLFKDLRARFPWQTSLKNQGTQGNNLILQDSLLKPQERCTVACRKSQGNGRKPAEWTGISCLS